MAPNPLAPENNEAIILNNMEADKQVSSVTEQPPADFETTQQQQPAVEVISAYKSFSNGVPVLKDFHMNVEQGTIYSLLGSSGCGKTTILSCIVGTRKLDSGDIFVFGQRPGTKESGIPGRRLGYMPQDIALYRQLSIKEMLQYFGRIYGMTHSEILGRIEFLSHFLDLPPVTRHIGDLSGGQSRRTSLSCALIHEPDLLILDEPTVGVDPLLRCTIWTYLKDLVAKKHVTIIITSHYIEECKASQKVGLMRNGKLLAEKSPETLMQEHHARTLEEIVLKLCKKDLAGFGETHHENTFYSKKKTLKSISKIEEEPESAVVGLKFKQNVIDENQNQNQGSINKNNKNRLKRQVSIREQATQGIWGKYSKIRAIAIRNSLTLLRSPLFMLAIFFMPSFQVVITNLTLGPEPKNLAFGIIDPEVNYDLSRCESPYKKCGLDTLSCQYIKSLPNNIIDPVSIRSAEEGLKGVQNGDLWGYMEFPRNYSKFLSQRAAESIFAGNETIDGSTITLKMDQSHYFAAALLTKSLYESFGVFVTRMLSDCDQETKKAELPLHFRTPVYGTNDISFHDYIGPAVLLVILFFIPYLSCSVYNITDRKQGTLDRSMVAGIQMTDLYAAFFCTEGFLIVVQTLISYLLVLFVFQMEIKGSVIAFLLILLLVGIAGLSLGFLIAQLVDEEMEALIIGVGFYMPNLIFCGIIWPLEAAPWFIRYISYCLPCTWPIKAIRSIISRGWPMTHSYVWPGYAILLAWIFCTWILASIVFKRRFK